MQAKLCGLILLLISFNSTAIKCEISGCNNELCIKPGDGAISICLWKAEYDCYPKYGICEADKQGNCGWRQTAKLVECMRMREQEVEATDLYSD